MKIILVMVTSLDGRTTNAGKGMTYEWTSKEDQDYFSGLIKNAKLIFMGRNTYEVAKGIMKNRQGRLRVVLTHHGETYTSESVPGQLEFSDSKVATLVGDLERRGFTEALLVGGSQTNAQFFENGLIDEIWLTVEPIIFGVGNSLATNLDHDIKLQFLGLKKLNTQGTLLLKYEVAK